MTPSDFAELLREQGFRAKESVAGGRVAQILSGSEGIECTITFYPHQDGGSSLEEFSSFTLLCLSKMPDENTVETLLTLNESTRYLKFYSKNNVMYIEMDVGIPSDKLDAELAMRQFNLWIIGLSRAIKMASE